MTARRGILQLFAIAAVLLAACGAATAASPSSQTPSVATLTDVRIGDHDGFTRVVFEFQPAVADKLPRFQMRYQRYPYRLEVDLFEVEPTMLDFPKASLGRSATVTAVGVLPDVGDQRATRAVVCLAVPCRYEIRIYPDPLRLILDLRAERGDTPPGRVWAVRVDTRRAELRRLVRLGARPAWLSLLPDAEGGVAVEAGAFVDAEAASYRCTELAALGISAAVVERGPAELPAAWMPPELSPAG